MFGIYQNSYLELQRIFQKCEKIEKVIIYGSRVKGNFKEGSDIDLTLIGNLDYNNLLQLKTEFDDSTIPYKIDISIFSNLKSKSLIDHITRLGQNFYEKTEIIQPDK